MINFIKKLFVRKGYTGVKVLITNHILNNDVKDVYDFGNGAFIYSHMCKNIRYLRSNGDFMNPKFHMVNGDAVKWESHIGDVSTLNFKDKQ